MQSVASTIWTRGVVSMSYDDNHYTTGTTQYILIRVQVVVLCIFWKTLYSCSVLKNKNAFKSIFQNIFSYTKVKVTEEDLYLVS